jgi:hypothetical protein
MKDDYEEILVGIGRELHLINESLGDIAKYFRSKFSEEFE